MSRRRDRDRQGARSLHVRGYDVGATGDRELRGVFETFGQVLDVYLPKDHYTKELRGFAYIQFAAENEAEEARRKLDRTDIFNDGREIHIMWAAGERKTPHDMRRLDVVRDNPHARRARIAQGGDWPRSPPRSGKRHRSPSPRFRERHYRDERDRSPYRRGRRGRSRSPYSRRDFRSPPRYGGRRSRSRSPHRRRGDRSPPPSYRRHSSPRRRDPRDPRDADRSPRRDSSRSPPVPRRGDAGERRDRGDSRSPYRRGSSRSPAHKRRDTSSRSPRRRSDSPGGWRKDPRVAPSGNTTTNETAENGNHHGDHSIVPGFEGRANGAAKIEERGNDDAKMSPVGDNFPK